MMALESDDFDFIVSILDKLDAEERSTLLWILFRLVADTVKAKNDGL